MNVGRRGVLGRRAGLKRDVGTHVLKEPNEKRLKKKKKENEGEKDSRGSFN